jgi:hypothetical protein
MPRPLLITFLVTTVAAIALVVVLMVAPPRPSTLMLAERHSPPRGSLTHDVGRIVAAPVPSPHAPGPAPCAAFSGTTIEAGAAGFDRVRAGLRPLCALTGPSISVELRSAIQALGHATIRFAGFQRTGEEATTDLVARRINVNVRFARSNSPTILVTPVLVHEGWHLANAGARVTASQEFRARTAELEACKLLIDRDKWIRNCDDAARIVGLGEARAISLLVAAGFPKE